MRRACFIYFQFLFLLSCGGLTKSDNPERVQNTPLQYISYSAVPNLPFAGRLLSYREGSSIVASNLARTESVSSYDACPEDSECTFMSKCSTRDRVQPVTRCEVALNQALTSMHLPGGICCRKDQLTSSASKFNAPVLADAIEAAAFGSINQKTSSYTSKNWNRRKSGKTPIVFKEPSGETSVSFLPGQAPFMKPVNQFETKVPSSSSVSATSPPVEITNPPPVTNPPTTPPYIPNKNDQLLFSSSKSNDNWFGNVYMVPAAATTPANLQPLPPQQTPLIMNPVQPQPIPSPPQNPPNPPHDQRPPEQRPIPLQNPPNQPPNQQQPPPGFPPGFPPGMPMQQMAAFGRQNNGVPMMTVPFDPNHPSMPMLPPEVQRMIQQQFQQNYPAGQFPGMFFGQPSMPQQQVVTQPPTTTTTTTTTTTQAPFVEQQPMVNFQRNSYNPQQQQTYCGVSEPIDLEFLGRTPRILGGRPAQFGKWPWMAVISTTARKLRCGGTILNEQFLITAAHCIYKNYQYGYYKDLIVRIGAFNLDDEEPEFFPPQEVEIYRAFVHPYFNTSESSFDVALIQVAEPIIFRRHIKPVCLPSYEHTGEIGTVLGWGKRRESDDRAHLPTVLQEVAMPILTPWQCIQDLRSNKIYDDIGPQFICAGGVANQDACRGDSGGPLLALTRGRFWELVGIVSKGYGCGKENMPGIYTNIKFVKPWIENMVAENWNTYSFFNPMGSRDRSYRGEGESWLSRLAGLNFDLG